MSQSGYSEAEEFIDCSLYENKRVKFERTILPICKPKTMSQSTAQQPVEGFSIKKHSTGKTMNNTAQRHKDVDRIWTELLKCFQDTKISIGDAYRAKITLYQELGYQKSSLLKEVREGLERKKVLISRQRDEYEMVYLEKALELLKNMEKEE